MNCGFGEKLILYRYGEAGEALAAEVRAHLAACAACRGEFAALEAAEAALSADAAGPSRAAVNAVMGAARDSRRGLFSFNWGEALLSGGLAAALFFILSVSGHRAADLAWNSGLDARLDSVEYSVYQAQADMSSSSMDWEYGISSLEDETLDLSKNV
ncbi:MAG: zf-HC2 domain-containing protein [Elusimicrobia bacterium]|nr:zf-HC2 domain-containing protein [Elusimicrobiota bacterium]